MKMESSTQLWYIRASAGRYVFRWDRLLDQGLAFVEAGVPSCPDDVTLRSCTREFQMWRRRCKQIDPHWYQERQMRFWWMLSTMSWKRFMIYKVRLLSTANISPDPSGILFSTVYWLLLLLVNHSQQPVTSRLALTCCGSVSTLFSRKTYFLCINQYIFKTKNVYFIFYNIFICTTCKHFTL